MSWDNPHAWRDSYDEWKTRLPDWWDAPDSEDEDEPEYRYVHQRRHTLRQIADRSIDGNPAALVARHIRRANDNLRRITKRIAQRPEAIEREKHWARTSIALAKHLRIFIGPPCPDDMIPF